VYTWPFCLELGTSLNQVVPLTSPVLTTPSCLLNGVTTNGGTSASARVYAVNYNILRVKNGMAGVAFGN
jgi:hypothetical protein